MHVCRAHVAAVAFLVAVRLGAGELPPWAAEHDGHRRQMEHMADMEARGQLRPEQEQEVNRYWASHLRRGMMNAVGAAHYAIAEIHLRQGKAGDAIAELQRIAAATASEDVRSLTHLNLAEIQRRVMGDATKARAHYEKVKGTLQPRAQAFLVAMLAQTGKMEQAAAALEKLIADAQQQGEKLALLQRLAALYERAKLIDKALATYTRITDNFTEEDLAKMRQDVAREVAEAAQKIEQHRMAGNGEEIERLIQQMMRRGQELRSAGRWDEFVAYQRAFESMRRQLFQRDRKPQRPPQPHPADPPPHVPAPDKKREGEF